MKLGLNEARLLFHPRRIRRPCLQQLWGLVCVHGERVYQDDRSYVISIWADNVDRASISTKVGMIVSSPETHLIPLRERLLDAEGARRSWLSLA